MVAWSDPALDEKRIGFVRDFYEAAAPLSESAGYINFMSGDDQGKIAENYGPSYVRLRQVKKAYDPENLFHLNQNISPA
jgi:FAD/FMN-containing dehydrogenase